ncbi:MAG: hypothetical protein GY951_08815 [Psychromonas sp.]|nr:hypothetical protein [Psychromonas sp.]
MASLLESDKQRYQVSYDAFYTLADEKQLQLETAFRNVGFNSFSLFE